MKKNKTYVITISKRFPSYHPRKGETTDFGFNIFHLVKKHTIRANYEFWKKRIDEVNNGKARLSVREWTGKPYFSKQSELFNYGKVGIQKCDVEIWDDAGSAIIIMSIDEKPIHNNIGLKVITNDGLKLQDFIDWFRKPIKDGCIIHFTDLRY